MTRDEAMDALTLRLKSAERELAVAKRAVTFFESAIKRGRFSCIYPRGQRLEFEFFGPDYRGKYGIENIKSQCETYASLTVPLIAP